MLFDQIASNKRKTWILLLVFFLLLALVGYAVGYLFMRSGLGGMIIALIIGLIYALTMIFQSTEIVMSMRNRDMTIGIYVENIILHHLETYKDEINRLAEMKFRKLL